MSDARQQTNTKTIQLKPITFPVIESDTSQTAEEEKLSQLKQLTEQIQAAEQQLEKTNQTIKTKVQVAKEEIETLRTEWLTEKQQLIKETKQVAFSEGYQEGQEHGLQSLTEKLTQADDIVETARAEYLKILGQNDATVLELAIKIASKIINYEIVENNAFIELVKAAIQEVHDQPSIKLYTSTDDYETVTDQRDQLMTLLDPETILTIHPLATMETGECVIKTPYSKLDVSVDQQLTKIKTRLFEVMEEIRREHR
ncbi:MAG TPA: hypothetical protein GXZ58_03760 [Bacilli bacterium]|nr:hypothetical protein [Bacilli bacterium]